MKKLLVITCSILIAFLLFTFAFRWYFQPSRIHPLSYEESREALVAQLEKQNAARYYLQACQALDDSVWSESLFESYDDVLQKGWRREYPDLEDYLKRNESALELVRKGTQQEFCSMPLNDPSYGLSYFSSFREIARLMVIKGELLRWREEYAEAARLYSDLFRFCADASDKGIVLHALSGMAMEGLAYEGLERLVARLNEDAVCATLLDEMIDIESGRVSLRRILESDLAYDHKFLKERERDLLYYDVSFDSGGIVNFFINPIKRVRRYVMFRLFKTRYVEEADSFRRYVAGLVEKPYPDIPHEELAEKIRKNDRSRSRYEKVPLFIFLTVRQTTIRRANIICVALHLHCLQSGTYPEKLDELTAAVPEGVLIDPFSNNRFLYRKTDDGYLLYSVGGNMKDDGGIQAKPPWHEDKPGDIVFEQPIGVTD